MAPSFNPAKDIPSLEGKVVLVTGGNTGLGKQTITYLAAHAPHAIYLAARTESKAQAAIDDIKTSFPDARIEYLPLDLTSFESVAAAAKTFNARESRLDLLINNAGIMMTPYDVTREGYEQQLGTNHMGHALLTKLLLPVLLATAEKYRDTGGARIVNVSSLGHYVVPWGGIVLDKSKWPSQFTLTRYGQSKVANILFTREFAERYPDITSVSIHPGVILTDLFTATWNNAWFRFPLWCYSWLWSFLPGHYRDTEAGALNQTWAATVDVSYLENGAYYMPVGKKSKGSPYSRNKKAAKDLWEWTEAQFEKHGY